MCLQDMIFKMNVLVDMGLKVELPMVLEIDNKGAVDLLNSWSVNGHTSHMGTKLHWARMLKLEGKTIFVWKAGDTMTADINTKNVPEKVLNKHRAEIN